MADPKFEAPFAKVPPNQPLQTIPPQGHRVESRRRLGGGLAAERQIVRRTPPTLLGGAMPS
jgi:hypothetical protein